MYTMTDKPLSFFNLKQMNHRTMLVEVMLRAHLNAVFPYLVNQISIVYYITPKHSSHSRPKQNSYTQLWLCANFQNNMDLGF